MKLIKIYLKSGNTLIFEDPERDWLKELKGALDTWGGVEHSCVFLNNAIIDLSSIEAALEDED